MNDQILENLIARFNLLQDRVDELDRFGPRGGAWTDYSDISTIVGWSSYLDKLIRYSVIGKLVFVDFNISGPSNSTSVSFTVPFSIDTGGYGFRVLGVRTIDNGITGTNPGYINLLIADPDNVIVYKDAASSAWTSSGTKQIVGQFFYKRE